LKPKVLFNPVKLEGSMVKQATGHNAKFIFENRIGPGSKIIVIKSGSVIPKI
jgi:NAD-dependent DNA ligase